MPPEAQDQDVVRLAKAIRQVESGNNETAVGKSGEFGLYQFMPDTWASTTRKYGLDPNDRSRANQNKAAYLQIKELKDKGYKPDAISAFWNSGKLEGWQDNRGVNKYGVAFDTPAYVEKVKNEYQGQRVTAKQTQPALAPDLLGQATKAVTTVFPGGKVGEAIGTLAGYAAAPQELKETYSLTAPTPIQVAGDIAQGALMVGAGVPGSAPIQAFGTTLASPALARTALGRIGQAATVGGGVGLTGGLARGEEDLKGLAKSTATGAAVGGALGTGAELISAVGRTLPEWFVRSYIPKINKETARYAIKSKTLGSPAQMLEQSDSELNKIGQSLKNKIRNPKEMYIQPSGEEILTNVANSFKGAGLTMDDVVDNLKSVVPLQRANIDKLARGTITLDELHDLNSQIGRNTYKTRLDTPVVRAGKDIANEAYQSISNIIKTAVPESVPDFNAYAKEIQLNQALQALKDSVEKRFARVGLYDLLSVLGGQITGGPIGAAALFATQRALTSPTVNLRTAGLLSRLPQTSQGPVLGPIRGLITRGITGVQGQ